ncbi:Zinc-ribbon containing domain-containing protein [Oceanobacillus limi]|uniref:Zinc-ribbon containing domain-containing protein n=1 Tax=Oceanobacillus limi TaxID=930131 RepID=A0A1I0GH19_9BACI|nr:DUF2614 family zinc ribbon-containing protein [Oceanobacillus limi]SET69430.1 Zinc-ribbon containing domain-containing protein [Oceanobacillus limi]
MSHAYEYMTLEITKKKPKKLSWAWRIPAMVVLPAIALFMTLIGLLMSLTIIGFIFAIPLFMGALGMAVYPFAPGKFKSYKVTCPNCDKKATVLQDREDFKCRRCGMPVALKWHS